MRRTPAATLLAAALLAAPAQAQLIPFPTPAPEPTPTPEATPVGGQAPPAPPAPAPGLSAVAGHQDAARSGSSGDASLAGPLGLAWAVELRDQTEALVTGGGRVYASRRTTDTATGRPGRTVDALDAASGRRLWSSPDGGQLAYGEERVAVAGASSVRLLDAATGALVWEVPSGWTADDVLIAGGVVYHRGASNAEQEARSLADGSLLWERDTDGTGGQPAVVGDRFYNAGPCHAEAYDRRNGALLWSREGGCASGGGGGAAVLWRDRLLPRGFVAFDAAQPLAAADGAPLTGALADLVTGDVGVTVTGNRLQAVRLPDGAPLWAARGTGAVGLPGAVASRDATGRLAVRDAVTGAVRWTGRVRGTETTQDGALVTPVAGEGRLIVAKGSILVALAPRGTVPGLETTLRSTVGPAGRAFRVPGAIAGPLVPGAAELQVRRGTRWRVVARATPSAAGRVGPRVTLRRNVRARLAGPGLAPSRPVVLYAQPSIASRVRQAPAGGRVRVSVRLGRIPGLRPAGRTIALYYTRGRSQVFRRLATARLDGAGRGSASFPPLPAGGATIYSSNCLVGARRLGLGGPDPVTRRCGAATIRAKRR